MDFDSNKPIYLQIAGLMMDKILNQSWCEGNRIPSVRELSVEMEVNPNTTIRAYNYLNQLGIIHNERGIGYFVTPGGLKKAQEELKAAFIEEELPKIKKTMELLSISFDELSSLIERASKNENDK